VKRAAFVIAIAACAPHGIAAPVSGEPVAWRAAIGHELGQLARLWHHDAVALGDARLDAALGLYRAAIALAPDAPDAGDTLYYTGELMWTRAERGGTATPAATWREIAETYDRALEHDVPDANRKEGAYAAFMAWRSALGDPKEDPPADATRPYTEAEAVLLREARRDLELDPKRDPNVVFYAARIAWSARHADDAVPLFAELLDRDDVEAPPADVDQLAGYAGAFLLDTLAATGDLDGVTQWIARLRARPRLLARHADLAAIVGAGTTDLARKDAEEREKHGDWRGCAEKYEAILRDHPDADRGDEIAYDEAVCWSQAGERDRAADAYREVIKRASADSPLADRARLELERQASATTP